MLFQMVERQSLSPNCAAMHATHAINPEVEPRTSVLTTIGVLAH